MRKSFPAVFFGVVLSLAVLLTGCVQPMPTVVEKEVPVTREVEVINTVEVVKTVEVEKQVNVEKVVTATPAMQAHAKYVFVFIGDGMAVAQRNAAELYLASTQSTGARPEDTHLLMNTFPVQGMNTTYDLTSVIPDSASTATAIATGFKTKSGVLGMDATGKVTYENISEVAKKAGWKVGIVSSVSIDHATPAAFYAHVPTRSNMYDINIQLGESGFDYFAGGQMHKSNSATEGQPNALDAAKAKGYKVVTDRAQFDALEPGSDKIIAYNDLVDGDHAMYYTIDQPDSYITLAEFTAKGIELLDNPSGFFMMVEGGKIDWACHANDAASSILDTIAFDQAIAEAYEFYEAHPDETLIIVTGDHETGGMTIGFAGTQYSAFFDKIQNQTESYIEFSKQLATYKETHTAEDAKFDDVLPMIEQAFGLYVLPAGEKTALQQAVADGTVEGATDAAKKAAGDAQVTLTRSMAFTDLEVGVLEDAFAQSILGVEERAQDDYTYLLYGGYEPLAVKLTTILNQKAGIAWTSYSHTGVPAQTSAVGVGAESFGGYYDQDDIHTKLMAAAGFTPTAN